MKHSKLARICNQQIFEYFSVINYYVTRVINEVYAKQQNFLNTPTNEVSEHMRSVRIFAGVYCRGVTNRSGGAKVGNFSHHAASFLRYFEMCGHL